MKILDMQGDADTKAAPGITGAAGSDLNCRRRKKGNAREGLSPGALLRLSRYESREADLSTEILRRFAGPFKLACGVDSMWLHPQNPFSLAKRCAQLLSNTNAARVEPCEV